MFKSFGLIIIFILPISCYSQNLVRNGSFEDFTNPCPKFGELEAAKGWFQITGSTDYFNPLCSLDSDLLVPNNIHGFQKAKTGECYAGFVIYADEKNHANYYYREYLHTKLKRKLEENKRYVLTFYLSLAEASRLYSNSISASFVKDYDEIKKIGLYSLLKAPNQITLQLGEQAKDTSNWIKVELNYLAKGGEQYLIIGSFSDDFTKREYKKLLKNNIINSNGRYCYYCIDDISVELIN